MYPPFSFKEHDLMLCHFSLAALKGIMLPLHNWCRYLLVGRSIPCQGGSPVAPTLTHGLLAHFTPPSIFFWLALPAVTQFSEW